MNQSTMNPVRITSHYTPIRKNTSVLVFTATFEDGSQKKIYHIIGDVKNKIIAIRPCDIGEENAKTLDSRDLLYRYHWTNVPNPEDSDFKARYEAILSYNAVKFNL